MAEQKKEQHLTKDESEVCNIPNEEYETQFYGFAPTDVFEGSKCDKVI